MALPTLETDWNNEYNFWHKLISEEVERLRFNEGFEPIRVNLYPINKKELAFIGETQIGHVYFRVRGQWGFDPEGKKVLKISILKAP